MTAATRPQTPVSPQYKKQSRSAQFPANVLPGPKGRIPAFVMIDPASLRELRAEIVSRGMLPIDVTMTLAGTYKDLPMRVDRTGIRFNEDTETWQVIVAKYNVVDLLEFMQSLSDAWNLQYVACMADNETGVQYADLIAACFGLPHNSLRLLRARRDKAEMKRAVAEAGLRVAKYTRVFDSETVPRTMLRHHFPVVVKSPQSAGTDLVFVCKSEAEVRKAVSTVLQTRDCFNHLPCFALVEEFIEGQEYAVNMMATPHEVKVTDVWRYDKRVDEHGTPIYEQAELETDIESATYTALAQYGERVARAVGIERGPAHMEARMTKDGPVMIEIAARFCGGRKPSLSKDAIEGWDPFKAAVDVFLGRPVQWPPSFRPLKYVKHVFLSSTRDGVVESVEGLEEIKALPSFYHLERPLAIHPGTVITHTGNYFTYPAFVYLMSSDRAQIEADYQAVMNHFQVRLVGDPPLNPPSPVIPAPAPVQPISKMHSSKSVIEEKMETSLPVHLVAAATAAMCGASVVLGRRMQAQAHKRNETVFKSAVAAARSWAAASWRWRGREGTGRK
mmetsp:Transcript_16298/g.26907  ORF Transcript_16298/g.26907 Transcript_16298/m.26907 type:complete len:560 (+) Transcript_16298:107-1786(+)